jgi:thermostable 8-oxoguanine DNA glycosylase
VASQFPIDTEVCIPASPGEDVIPGVKWGMPEAFFTPGYWFVQYWSRRSAIERRSHRLGDTLIEEVVACLLGGHGIPAEIGLAAFERLRERQIINSRTEVSIIADALREPLLVQGRVVRYRFWSQKSRYIAAALEAMSEQTPPLHSATALRSYLMRLPGIGPKTSSWVVRNWTNSSEVAILDIHIVRAGLLMGLFSTEDDVTKKYFSMESRFLQLAAAMKIPAADLDSLIWSLMRSTPRIVARALSLTNPSYDLHGQQRQSRQVRLQLS